MTTYVTWFQPPNTPFTFQATLDGTLHTLTVTWNVFGRRYYVNCFTLSGVRVFTLPRIGSPVGADISLTAGYFATTLVWRAATGQFEIGA